MYVELKSGESIAGVTFDRKETMHLKNYSEIMELMKSMEDDNRKMLDESIIQPMELLQSSISCPLLYGGECIGVFVLDNYVGKDPLTKDDVYLAELISEQATIAISNAENYEKELKAQQELKSYSEIIEMEKNRYQYSTYLHNKFTEMILKKSDVDDIIKEVSLLLQSDVFVIDPFYTISYYAGSFRVTIEDLNSVKSSLIEHMLDSTENMYFSDELKFWILLYPVAPANEVMGWIGVVLESNNVTELDKIAVEKGANVVALDMMKQNEMSNLEQSIKGDSFDNLINSGSPEVMLSFSKRYKIDLEKPHLAILFKIEFPQLDNSHYKLTKYLYEEINTLAIERFRQSLPILKGNIIVVLIDDSRGFQRKELLDFHKDVLEKSQHVHYSPRKDLALSTLVSEKIRNWKHLRSSYHNAIRLLDLIPGESLKDNCIFYEDYEVKRFLLKAEREELEDFARKIFLPLTNYSGSSRKELFETLITYIVNNGNWTRTKEKLHIHGNTLTYRLNRLQEILDTDLDNYEKRFRLQLAIEILSIYPDIEKEICPASK